MNSLAKGKYKIDFKVMHKNQDEASVMANYLATSAIITKETDLLTMTLMLLDHETVLGFQIEIDGEWVEAINFQVDDEVNRRYELYELTELREMMNARVQYEVEHEERMIKSDEEIRIKFDQNSLESV